MNSHQPHPDLDAPSLEEITAPEGRADTVDISVVNAATFDAG